MHHSDTTDRGFFPRQRDILESSYWMLSCIPIVALLVFSLLAGCGANAETPGLHGSLLVVGELALQPFVKAAALLFQKQNPLVHIDIQASGSVVGLQAVASHKADIAMSSIYADPIVYPSEIDHLACVIPGVIVVGPGIPISSLTHDQVMAIFATRTIQNWKDLGGPALPIIPVMYKKTSGLQVLFEKYILQNHRENGAVMPMNSDAAMYNFLVRTPGAIGYIGLANLTAAVHPIAIDGQMPTFEAISQQNYTFWGFGHMYTSGIDSSLKHAFLTFLRSALVQQETYRLGYFPLNAGNFETLFIEHLG